MSQSSRHTKAGVNKMWSVDARPHPGPIAIELSPAAGPHWQAPNLNPNRNLARLRFLEIKSKITIKIGKKPFRLNSMAVLPGPLPQERENGSPLSAATITPGSLTRIEAHLSKKATAHKTNEFPKSQIANRKS